MSDPNKNDFETKLKRLFETIDTANLLTEPLTASIRNFLEVSAADMNSGEASVLIRDGSDGDLRFLSAIGEVAEQLSNMTIPAGRGIAGFVLSSGQPMAVADVGEEESFYADIDKETGYSTQTILATPLRHKGEIIGVLEYINRRGNPPFAAFTPDEMDKAAVFADAMASLVSAYESAKLLHGLGDKIVSEDDATDFAILRKWLSDLRETREHREMMDLAVLLREISSRGEVERKMCREILEAVLGYSKSKDETTYLAS
jgi:Nif-specific regulatory protein